MNRTNMKSLFLGKGCLFLFEFCIYGFDHGFFVDKIFPEVKER